MSIRMSFLVMAGIGLSYAAAANTIHVCPSCAHTTIQAAVNDAASGDSISIAAGRYLENVTIEDKSLTLQGGVGVGVTEVDAAGAGPVFTLGSGVAGAAPELIEMHNLVIAQGNHTGGTGVGGGVQVRAGAYLHIYDSTVMQNSSLSGGGIGVNSPGAPQSLISGCLIYNNSASFGGGGVEVVAGSVVAIQGSTISQNASTGGGGIYSDPGTQLTITNSIVSSNTIYSAYSRLGPPAANGGGLAANGSFNITGSSFVNNVVNGENSDYGGGLALNLQPGDTHVISNTIIARNSFTTANQLSFGGGIAALNSNAAANPILTLGSVYVVENTATTSGGGIWTSNVTLGLTNTTVKDNVNGQICDNNTGCN